MEQRQKIGNMTDYFVNPCPYTFKYYQKQIHDALKQAFKENPGWMKPGSRKELIFIIDEIREWYHPFLYTDLVSSTFDSLWNQAMNELMQILNERLPKVKQRKNSSKFNRVGKRYDPVKLEKLIEGLREQGMSLKMIGDTSGVHFTTISHMKKGTGPYWRKIITPSLNTLIIFLESLGIEATEFIISDKSDISCKNYNLQKLWRGVQGDGFLEKSPPGRRRQDGRAR